METRPVVAGDGTGQPVVRSAAMREVLDLAAKIARLETPVLIEGEPGVGKDMVARYVHRQSRRGLQPFVRVVCGSLHESEVDETLFGPVGWGHRTDQCRPPSLLASAHRGTLFLDEVSRLPVWAQTKLLDVVQLAAWAQSELLDVPQRGDAFGPRGDGNGLSDVRLIAATTCDLEVAVAAGRFNPGLYYYLNVVRIHVPPLRQRREDIRALGEHFLLQVTCVLGRPPDGTAWHFSGEAWECLLGFDWPGNAPQLASVVARAVVLADTPEINRACIAQAMGPALDSMGAETIPVRLAGGLTAMELAIVEAVIRRCQGNKAAAARTLGLHRRTLYRILNRKARPLALSR